MNSTRRTLLAAAGATLAAPAFITGARAQRTNVLRFVPEFDLPSLDPIVNTALPTNQHGYMVYDTLFAMDSSFTPRPQMVERYTTSADGLQWDFTLRENLRFHDGSPVRARDAAQSIRRWGARDVFGRLVMARTAALDAVDDRNFRLRLREPYPVLLDALAKVSSNVCFVMRERDAETEPTQAVSEVVGSGPYRYVRAEHVPGSRVVYEKFDGYVPRGEPADGYAGGKIARVARVEWHISPVPGTQAYALSTGEVDFVNSPSFDLLRVLRRARGVTVAVLDKQGWMGYMRPNHLHPPFNDVRARQALAHLVDQADYLRAAAADQDNWNTCRAFLVCGSPIGTEAGMDAYAKPDLDRARALLAEAGYKGEPIVVLHPTDNPILGGLSEVTISQLRKIGANVEVIAQDLAAAFARRANRQSPTAGGWHIFHTRSLGVEMNNPLTSFALASPCETDSAGNRTGWFGWSCDAAIERLRNAYATAATAADRRTIGEQLQAEAVRHLPYIPLGQILTPVAHRSTLSGVIAMPIPVMWNISMG